MKRLLSSFLRRPIQTSIRSTSIPWKVGRLESRVMLDGAATAEIMCEVSSETTSAVTSENPTVASPTTPTRADAMQRNVNASIQTLVVVDPQAVGADLDRVLAGVDANADVLLLDSSRPAIPQISQRLQDSQDLTSLQIITHGTPGVLQFSSGSVAITDLQENAASIRNWRSAFRAEGDILLVSCETGAGQIGAELLEAMSALTGTDVAASSDKTGTRDGANWNFEVNTGTIESSLALTADSQQDFETILRGESNGNGASRGWGQSDNAISRLQEARRRWQCIAEKLRQWHNDNSPSKNDPPAVETPVDPPVVTPPVTPPVGETPIDPPVVTPPVDETPVDPPVVTPPVDETPVNPPVVTPPVCPPVVTPPVDETPVDPPVVTPPVDETPVDPPVVTPPVDETPVDPPVVTPPVDETPVDPPVVTPPVDETPVDPPVVTPPVDETPVDPPVVTPPVVTPPTGSSVVAAENALPGTPGWELTNKALSREIEGYASSTSINAGESVNLFVNTASAEYSLEVFRMGYYGGVGARSMGPAVVLPGIRQIEATPDPITGLTDNNWVNPYTVQSGSDWVSGMYVAKLTTADTGKQKFIPFVVRNDNRADSDFVYQFETTTWQAYNAWGGKSLYTHNSTDGVAADKVSFNRPYDSTDGAGRFFYFSYDMLRWVEQQGYDVTYISSLDTHTSPNLLSQHDAFLTVGHDEYWSWEMRNNLEAVSQSGVDIGIFSANTGYWQVRFEKSQVTGGQNRTMVAYKDTTDPILQDADAGNDYLATVRFRESPVNRPEETFVGVQFGVEQLNTDMIVTNTDHWIYAGTGLNDGDVLPGVLGYEVDGFYGNQPANIEVLASTPVSLPGQNPFVAHMTVYQQPNGSYVFSTGTIQWGWGLDDWGRNDYFVISPRLTGANPAVQQITKNLFDRFIS